MSGIFISKIEIFCCINPSVTLSKYKMTRNLRTIKSTKNYGASIEFKVSSK